MIRTLGYVALGLGLAVVLVVAYASTKPDRFRVTRSVAIAAPPDAIFPLINDLKTFATWSPYEKKDPDMQRTFSGAASGVGQRYDWDGDSNVGKGWLAISGSTVPSAVAMDLNMVKPIEAANRVTFTLAPEGTGPNVPTRVTWAMEGDLSLMAKVVHLVFDVDKMVGGDFETGLADLKRKAEGAS